MQATLASLEDQLKAFLDDEYPRVVGAVSLITGDRAAAEDAVQDALTAAWARRDEIDLRSLPAWVTVVASNRAKTRHRRRRTEERIRPRLVEPEPPSSETLTTDALSVRAALPRLSKQQRQVAVLFYWLGLPVAEIATHLGVSDGTVKTSLSRARAHLADALATDEGNTDD